MRSGGPKASAAPGAFYQPPARAARPRRPEPLRVAAPLRRAARPAGRGAGANTLDANVWAV